MVLVEKSVGNWRWLDGFLTGKSDWFSRWAMMVEKDYG